MVSSALQQPASIPSQGPTAESGRITNLDLVRGVAVLGILVMNAVSYGLGTAAYFNLDAAGSVTALDWLVGALGEVLVDQKFMAIFSMLFGAGIVLFADRAAAKGRNGTGLSLWRNALLLAIGLAHAAMWDGDVLVVYALAAPLLIALRRQRPLVLAVLGVMTVALSAVAAVAVQSTVDAAGTGLGQYWFSSGAMSDSVGLFLLVDFFGRAIGMMLIGVALYRTGFITGELAPSTYRRLAVVGLGIGLPLAALGLAIVAAGGFGPGVALIGSVPNTIGTIPAAIGYVALISWWNQAGGAGRLRARLEAVGRMALTNYLSQTIIGLLTFRGIASLVADGWTPTRSVIAGFVAAVWLAQLWWSPAWLGRFRYGPAEWLWRCATYRRWQPLRRRS